MFGRGWLFQADGEVWEELDLGGALNVLFGSLPACTPGLGLGRTRAWEGAWVPPQVCPMEATFQLALADSG